MGDEDDGALVIVERIEQCAAAVDVEVVGRLVEDEQMRRRHRDEIEQKPRALAAGEIGDRGVLLVERQAELRQARAPRRFAVVRQFAAHNFQRRIGRVERFDLMLMKPADFDAALALHLARLQRQRPGDHLGEGRFAGAVDAEQPDPVVDVEPQIELPQHGLAVVADGGAFELQQGRRQRTGRRRHRERRDALLDHFRDRLELGQALDARLRLRGLARLGAEAVDETLQMRALGVLLGLGGGLQPVLLRPPVSKSL